MLRKPRPSETFLNTNLASAWSLHALLLLNEGVGRPRDWGKRNRAVRFGSAESWIAVGPRDSPAVKYAGVSSGSSITLDLSDTAVVTLELLALWDAFANDDLLMGEFTANFNTNPPAFIIDPNDSLSSQFSLQMSNAGPIYRGGHFTRPSAAVFHHYLFVFDRGANTVAAFVDGVAQTITYDTVNNMTGNFQSSTLFIMSRNDASLFGKGQIAKLAVYKQALLQPHATLLSANPWVTLRYAT